MKFAEIGKKCQTRNTRALLSSLPTADWLVGDRGYDADWFREALADKKITPCIPGRKSRDKPVKYDKRCYRKRNCMPKIIQGVEFKDGIKHLQDAA